MGRPTSAVTYFSVSIFARSFAVAQQVAHACSRGPSPSIHELVALGMHRAAHRADARRRECGGSRRPARRLSAQAAATFSSSLRDLNGPFSSRCATMFAATRAFSPET